MSSFKEPFPSKEKYSYRKLRNHQACVEAVLLSLVNKYAEIVIRQPLGKSTVALPFFPIKSIKFSEDDILDVDKFVDQKIEEIKIQDISKGITKETAMQRRKSNRVSVTIDLLADILMEKGLIFGTSPSSGKNDSFITETYNSIYFSGKWWDKKKIETEGGDLNKKLYDLVGKGMRLLSLKMNSPVLFLNEL